MNKLKNRNADGKLLTYQQTGENANLGIGTVKRLARESGALVRIGRTPRVDWDRFYEYVITVYRED